MTKSKYVFGDAYWDKTLVRKHLNEVFGRFFDEAKPNRQKKVLIRAKRTTKWDSYVIEKFLEKWWAEAPEHLDMEEANE